MKTYTNGLLSASGDLSEYTVTKTDESGIARSETCTVFQEETALKSSISESSVSAFSSIIEE